MKPSNKESGTAGAARFALWVAGAALLFGAGLAARLYTWHITRPIRFVPDLTAAWHWGSLAAKVGWLNLYDLLVRSHPDGNYILDYVPLRLLVCTWWVRLNAMLNPGATAWEPSWFFHAPLLAFHTLMELLAAGGAFVLVRSWLVRCAARHSSQVSRRTIVNALALTAAAAVWLNPASLINSHGRPGTDVWILPFYIWSVHAAVTGRWLVSGLIVAAGSMLKGQQMIVAPVFIVWPLCLRRPGDAARWLIGFALGAALCVSPWLLTTFQLPARTLNVKALCWCASVTAFAFLLSRRLPSTWRLYIPAATAAVCLFLCILVFGSGAAWFEVGLGYGAEKYSHDLSVGGAFCLASIVEDSLGLQAADPLFILPRRILVVWPPRPVAITAHRSLSALYVAMLAVSSVMMARTCKNRDRRFLTAIALPWLVWFAFAPQIHERYLLFGAVVAGLSIGTGTWPFLAGLMLSGISCLMTLGIMLNQPGVEYGSALLLFVRHLYPHLSWLVIATVSALLFSTRTPHGPRL